MNEQDIEKAQEGKYQGVQESLTTSEGNETSLPEIHEPETSRSMFEAAEVPSPRVSDPGDAARAYP